MRAILGVVVMLIGASAARADEEKIPIDRLPKAVAAAVKKRFPMAKITAAVKETEDKKTTYEVTLKDGTSTIDVDVTEAGTITGWEKEIAAKDLPKAVADSVAAKYPNAKMKKVEELIKVTAGKEKLECYEVTVEVDGKDVEVEFLPDGKPKGKK
jgi:uncharacterized membrane protein YkoI